jgi:cytochrome c peroxidase
MYRVILWALIAQSGVALMAQDLPKGFPKPPVPIDNPPTTPKIELGRYLFYDRRLSVNGKSSCATCHRQELAFTDGLPRAVGATGEKHPRGAMSLVNVAYSAVLTWSNPGITSLEQQALVPMFGEKPLELGLRAGDGFLARLKSDPKYHELFAHAFPADTDPFTVANVAKAIASFERSIVSARSPYDRYHYGGDDSAVSDSAKRGEILFFSRQLSCFRCHGGFNFSGNTISARHPATELEFRNNGVYGAPGLFEFTKDPKDSGKFKAPTLRNIALTAPYMHDGSLATLDAVVSHYAAGGHKDPNQDPLVAGFALSSQDRIDLIEFLKSLTDEAVLQDRRFANPW